MLIVSDNDVAGAVSVIRRIIESARWREFSAALDLSFCDLVGISLERDAPDQLVWESCQSKQALLISGNRSGGVDSLDRVIRNLGSVESLPVITLANAMRTLRDAAYAERCAISLLDLIERIDTIRGTGRLFIP
jgi:hypothetical protein